LKNIQTLKIVLLLSLGVILACRTATVPFAGPKEATQTQEFDKPAQKAKLASATFESDGAHDLPYEIGKMELPPEVPLDQEGGMSGDIRPEATEDTPQDPTKGADRELSTRSAPGKSTAQVDSMQVTVFLVALGDNGRSGKAIGCGDSIVPVTLDVPVADEYLRASIETLLSGRKEFYGEQRYYNTLHQSNLRLQDVLFTDKQVTILLQGELILEGACDDPRALAQLEEIALQFPAVESVSIYINAVPLNEILYDEG